ncbi:MAG: BREX system ATP-binding domain-containing protein [Clostridiaceae bacterium]
MNIPKKELGILNSLKMGVIPRENLLDFMINKDYYLEEINRCINLTKENLSVAKMVLGDYGTGKSFLLNIIKEKALKENMVVASIQINESFKFNNLSDLYYEIMHSLSISFNDKEKFGFESIFDIWVKKLKSSENKSDVTNEINYVIASLNSYNSSYARAFLSYIKARIHNDNELAYASSSWIKGEKNIPYSIKSKFEIKGDIDNSNSVNMLKAFCKLVNLIGYSGVVILVDELDTLLNIRSDLRKSAYENIRFLIDNLGNGNLENSLFVFSASEKLLDDPDKGIKTYKPLYQRLGNAIDKKSSSLLDKRQVILRLKDINDDDISLLSSKIIDIHKTAYNWSPKISYNSINSWTLVSLKKEDKNLSSINTREYIIKLIEILDIMEQNPNNSIFNKELDTQIKNGSKIFISRSNK